MPKVCLTKQRLLAAASERRSLGKLKILWKFLAKTYLALNFCILFFQEKSMILLLGYKKLWFCIMTKVADLARLFRTKTYRIKAIDNGGNTPCVKRQARRLKIRPLCCRARA